MDPQNPTLNIESVKRNSQVIGLESEFTVHMRMMDSRFKERKFDRAAVFAENCKIICEELMELTKTPREPCVLTSPKPSSKPSSTD